MKTDLLIVRSIIIVALLIGLPIIYITCGWVGVAIFCYGLFWFIIGLLINYYIYK